MTCKTGHKLPLKTGDEYRKLINAVLLQFSKEVELPCGCPLVNLQAAYTQEMTRLIGFLPARELLKIIAQQQIVVDCMSGVVSQQQAALQVAEEKLDAAIRVTEV